MNNDERERFVGGGPMRPRQAWYVISGGELKAALERVADGDDPELVLIEIYANSEVRRPDEENE